jgi:polysaccharide biosynthesis transport protein
MSFRPTSTRGRHRARVPGADETVEVNQHAGTLRRQWRMVALFILVAAGLAIVYSARQTPVYQAVASVLVRPLSATPIQTGLRPDQVDDMASEQRIMQSEAVAAIAVKKMRVTAAPSELLRYMSADVPARSQIIRVSFRFVEPEIARRGANAFAEAYLAFRKENLAQQVANTHSSLQRQIATLAAKKSRQDAITSPDSSGTRQQRRSAMELSDSYSRQKAELEEQLASLNQLDLSPGAVIEPAELPTSPAGPGRLSTAGIGLLVGLLVGITVAFVRDRTDTRLRDQRDLADRLDSPVLGRIPKVRTWKRRPPPKLGWSRRARSSLVVVDEPDSPAAEAYRILCTRLTQLVAHLDVRSIMMVSPGPGEGKSTTVANLGVALAQSGRDVLLVSADLRRPRIHELFGLPNKSGLSNLLADDPPVPAKRLQATLHGNRALVELWSIAPHLWLILSGPLPPHPSALLDSAAMRQFLEEQEKLFDLILLDCPPALVADTLALASLVDGLLVVADAKQTDRSAVTRLREEFGQTDGKLIGAVFNRVSGRGEEFYYRTVPPRRRWARGL